MSHNNYMDRVPVKISEKFKPPPKIYQLPQAIVNRLQLSVDHYNESPQYDYNFQLERKVLAKMPEWRRMRQQEREARRERKERREQEHLFQIEAKNKQMLGAISYPSTDDLSSSDSDSDGHKEEKQNNDLNATNASEGDARYVLSTQVNSFHNILQPTIISSNNEKFRISSTTPLNSESHVKNVKIAGVVKEVNAFNYKDFEEDTSSPFDNIELKTINDLDILAQVLHNTQLPMQQKEQLDGDAIEDSNKSELEPKDNTHNIKVNEEKTIVDNITKDQTTDEDNLEVLENTKIALQKVNFENFGQNDWRNESIPNNKITNNSITNTKYFTGNNSNLPACTSYASFTNSQQCYQMSYNTLYNGIGEQQQPLPQHYANFNVPTTQGTTAAFGNHNYLLGTIYNDTISKYCSPRHLHQHSTATTGNNANNYGDPALTSSGTYLQNQEKCSVTNDYNDLDAKSKSVPDILRELSAEVRNSEIRRSRYYSFNSEEEKQCVNNPDADEDVTPKQSPAKVANTIKETNYYTKLPPTARRLVKNISSMGFPLERVAKISQIFGTDDKKIIEHLIPLSELMDLGFDESKISEALIQYDNNKEKALEYLIS